MNDDLRLTLQVGAPFVAALISSWVSWRTHMRSRAQVNDMFKIVTNGYALKAELKEREIYGHVEPRR